MNLGSCLELIESVKEYKVLFVGDAIIDEYHFVRPLSKAAKEHLIPMKYLGEEVYEGGVVAAAAHAKAFCAKVDVWKNQREVRKVRMVDKDSMRKLAEIHYERECADKSSAALAADVIVIADFGHGAINAEGARNWSQNPEFLAVSAQSNSANMGYNLITKYPRADYIVIDEPEARLAAVDQDGHIEDVIHKLAHGRCDKFVVTHGKHGAYGYENGNFFHAPSHTDLVRDTMGAGDAFFAVTAPMAKTGRMEDLLRIGNAAGAVKCGIVGHRASVTKEALIEYLKSH